MKKILVSAVSALALLAAADLAAQAPSAYPVYLSDSPSAPVAVLPYTTVKVCLAVEKEVVLVGPYARYAQRYLGVMAPLADRTTSRIVSARLGYADPQHTPQPVIAEQATGETAVSHVFGGNGFTRSNPDRISATDKPTEEMARDAANTIFALRRQRLDILTGEAGELYAGGLEATFSEISRMEDEYLALFLGKQSVITTVHEIDVVPTADRMSYIVCRFSDQDGVMADSDLSGQPVVLSFVPEKVAAPMAAPKAGKQQLIQWRVADFAECKLAYGQAELAKRRIPVYQFGVTITAPAQ